MIPGSVTEEGVPIVFLPIGDNRWPSIVDTGFNGDLELPESLRPVVNARLPLRDYSLLAGGQMIEEDIYEVEFPFDGKMVKAEASFVSGQEILLGTHLLRQYRLEIDFVERKVLVEQAPGRAGEAGAARDGS